MLQPLDGPGVYKAISVTDTAQEVKVGASVLDERKVLTIEPTDGTVYYGYDNLVTATSGTRIRKGQLIHIEASWRLPVWVVADTGDTVDTRITEVA